MTLLGSGLCLLGAVLLLVAAWGVVRLPDALSRQHAATKAGTLALAAFVFGVAVLMPEPAWIGRLALLLLLLLLTLPLASHALARAAARESGAVEDLAARGDER
ncbi:MAG TPA: monovalent cation/H(+) antiporter subunit G [Candidatus Competibacter sp.]|nr:monovalent cation/H(+) antiporter subunit G [Candidatus Competibacteraceae bacterium]HRE55017.1 monovalent cation/H(+) antiporter subunit G [Candidatus Competibacter sp.]HUM95979.1 monovalent cation/H(+) antiporter subunit G [Candidatus Competibacter sp.]